MIKSNSDLKIDQNSQCEHHPQSDSATSLALRDNEDPETQASDSSMWTSDDQELDHLLTQLYPSSSSSYISSTPSSSASPLPSHLPSSFDSPCSSSLSDLLNQARTLFSPSVIHIIQHDLINQFGIQSLLDDPQTLHNLDPDLPLIIHLLQSQPLLNEKQKAGVRLLVNRTLQDLLESSFVVRVVVNSDTPSRDAGRPTITSFVRLELVHAARSE